MLLGGWLLYEQLAHGLLRWDLLIILSAMAITKITTMIYYRLTE